MKGHLLHLDSLPVLDIVRRYVSENYHCDGIIHAFNGGGSTRKGNGRFRPILHW